MNTDRSWNAIANTVVDCRLRSCAVDTAIIHGIVDRLRSRLGLDDYQVGITFVGSQSIRTLNRQFRGYDKATDVLSFPQMEWPKPVTVRTDAKTKSRRRSGSRIDTPLMLGDIVISIPEADANARRIGQTLDREICFLIVHGFLHLCGYDHMVVKDEKRMLKAQNILMRDFTGSGHRPVWAGCVKKKVKRRKRAK